MHRTFQHILDPLQEAMRETFETLAFSEISDWKVTDTGPDTSPSCLGAAIALYHPLHCRLALLLNRDQVLEFVEIAYGPEIAASAGENGILQDSICELVNTIAGRFASALAQPDLPIALGIPETANETTILLEQCSNSKWIRFSLDGIPARCVLGG
jgi:hypothetical protein